MEEKRKKFARASVARCSRLMRRFLLFYCPLFAGYMFIWVGIFGFKILIFWSLKIYLILKFDFLGFKNLFDFKV
jgi:hypothetical protein